MKRPLFSLCAATALTLGWPVGAQELAADPFSEPAALSEPELSDMRGGILTPLGVEIGLGAEVRTYIDGQLALQTRLTWTDHGAVTEHVGDLSAVTATGLPDGWTATIPGMGGETQVLHNLTGDRIASVVLNTANGRDIRQDTDIRLIIPQLSELQAQLSADRITANVQNAVGLALADRTGR